MTFLHVYGQVKLLFMCESDKRKQQYLMKAFPEVPYLFADMRDLCKKCAFDVISGAVQPVPQAIFDSARVHAGRLTLSWMASHANRCPSRTFLLRASVTRIPSLGAATPV